MSFKDILGDIDELIGVGAEGAKRVIDVIDHAKGNGKKRNRDDLRRDATLPYDVGDVVFIQPKVGPPFTGKLIENTATCCIIARPLKGGDVLALQFKYNDIAYHGEVVSKKERK